MCVKHKDILEKLTIEQKCALLSGKTTWQTYDFEKAGLPSAWLSDGPNGLRKQAGAADHLGLNPSVPATCFPSGATLANSWDTALCEEVGKALGEECLENGVNVILGPALNVKRSPLCGRSFEYFSEDPYLSGKMAAAYVRGVQSEGVAACPKHFAANGQETRRMASNSVLDERTLHEMYLTAFEIVVRESSPKSVMTSYNMINGTYANENRELLIDNLREKWGFDGAVITDWGGSNDHVLGVKNGSTLEMPSPGFVGARKLIKALKDGEISESEIDERADELIELVLSTDKAIKENKKKCDMEKHHEIAKKAALESIVLLKNEDDILPIEKNKKVLLVGDFAVNPRYQGAGSSMVNAVKVDSLESVASESGLNVIGCVKGYDRHGKQNKALIDEATEAAKKADVVVVCVGLDESSESEGVDRSHILISNAQKELISALADVNENLVAVISAGSVIETDFILSCKACLHAYLSGEAGAGAIADVLTGKKNPSGKLAETIPLTYSDTPASAYFPGGKKNVEYREGIFVGYRYYETAKMNVRYPFGFGLSYTNFEYSDIIINENKVSFTLTNTGKYDGSEIAQLYIGKEDSEIFRPTKELKGFSKVYLKAGESKRVTIILDDKAFRYRNTATDSWETEGGVYRIYVGASVRDIRLEGSIAISGSGAQNPYEKEKLNHYYSADVKNVTKEEFEALLCRRVPEDKTKIDRNMTLGELNHSRSPICMLIAVILKLLLKSGEKRGKADLNIIFQYNMPLRAISQMTGGLIGDEFVDGLVMEAKGFWIVGILRAIIGIAENLIKNKVFKSKLKGN